VIRNNYSAIQSRKSLAFECRVHSQYDRVRINPAAIAVHRDIDHRCVFRLTQIRTERLDRLEWHYGCYPYLDSSKNMLSP
jgi:hypothetical protein